MLMISNDLSMKTQIFHSFLIPLDVIQISHNLCFCEEVRQVCLISSTEKKTDHMQGIPNAIPVCKAQQNW